MIGDGTTLRDWRLLKYVTQVELAEEVGCSYATIHRAENGFPIQRDIFDLICQKLGVEPGNVTGVQFAKRVHHTKKRKTAAIE